MLELLASKDASIVRRILREQAYPHWKAYGFILVMMAIAAASTALMAYLIGSIVDVVYVERNFPGTVVVATALAVLCLIKGLARYGQELQLARIGNRIVAECQERIFDKLLRENVAYFADKSSAQYMAGAIHGAASSAHVLNLLVMSLGRDILTVLSLVGLMFWQHPMLSLIGFGVMPLAVLGVQKLMLRAREIARNEFSASAAIMQTMQETIQGFRTIKAFNVEQDLRSRIARDIQSIEKASNNLAAVSNRSGPLTETLGGVGIALVCLYGGYQFLQQGDSPGNFVTFMTAFLLTFDPLRRLARLNVDLSSSLLASHIYFDLMDSPAGEPDDSHLPQLNSSSGMVRFRDVRFSYQPDLPVLRGISFVAEPAKVTALVGPSGGGKSTIFNLLLRFYDDKQGRITIDDQEIAEIRRSSLRRSIAHVGQDNFLLRGSVRDNILIGRPDATDEQLEAAAKAAHAHDFILELKEGYASQVGELGIKLSHGQRQRIAVARALIKDAPIILLDEPTAALDSESESKVQQAVKRLCAGRTTLVIAHRLNTIMHADQILVIEGGKIVESGRHDDLIRKNGRYARYFHLQFPDSPAGVAHSAER
ncbi:MAG: ABC transporter ATP-binding protein/permease [Alphaproteobacteria bacterium]|nr:ABC transporter ATP-binding protein/permease [Alphaproteobacteria bacterium]